MGHKSLIKWTRGKGKYDGFLYKRGMKGIIFYSLWG